MKLYKILGYAGAVPFWVMAALVFSRRNLYTPALEVMLMIGYGGMILSFLAGVHWAHALPRQHTIQIYLSMVPTILSFAFLLMLNFVIYVPFVILAVMGFFFWALYWMDLKFLEKSWLPDDYFSFRRNITIIVSLSFFVLPILNVF